MFVWQKGVMGWGRCDSERTYLCEAARPDQTCRDMSSRASGLFLVGLEGFASTSQDHANDHASNSSVMVNMMVTYGHCLLLTECGTQ